MRFELALAILRGAAELEEAGDAEGLRLFASVLRDLAGAAEAAADRLSAAQSDLSVSASVGPGAKNRPS